MGAAILAPAAVRSAANQRRGLRPDSSLIGRFAGCGGGAAGARLPEEATPTAVI